MAARIGKILKGLNSVSTLNYTNTPTIHRVCGFQGVAIENTWLHLYIIL